MRIRLRLICNLASHALPPLSAVSTIAPPGRRGPGLRPAISFDYNLRHIPPTNLPPSSARDTTLFIHLIKIWLVRKTYIINGSQLTAYMLVSLLFL
jgi:hypothetical protein